MSVWYIPLQFYENLTSDYKVYEKRYYIWIYIIESINTSLSDVSLLWLTQEKSEK